MKKIKCIASLMIASGLLLAIPLANATRKWQDIDAATSIPENSHAAATCTSALAEWRKKNCSSKTCTARWNGQWRNTTGSVIFGSKWYALCGTHILERSS